MVNKLNKDDSSASASGRTEKKLRFVTTCAGKSGQASRSREEDRRIDCVPVLRYAVYQGRAGG